LHIERDRNKDKVFENGLISNLLEIEDIKKLMSCMDQFIPQPREKKALEHLLHYYKETCIDHFFPRLMETGFRAGIPEWNEKMKPFRELYSYLLSEEYGYVIMTSRFFLMAGYSYQEVIDAVKERINLIYQAAQERVFGIYQGRENLPKTPKHWESKGIIRDELNPWLKMKPLPVIYDIAAMAYFPEKHLDPETKKKIDVIVSYVLDPAFQRLPEGYGLLWSKPQRRFYACGWSPTLPFYRDYPRPGNYNEYSLLYYVNLMSHFKVAQDSPWFQECMRILQSYQDEDGAFVFPATLLHQKYIPEAFLNESNLMLKRGKRIKMLNRVASTLFMYKLYQRIEEKSILN